MERSEVGLSLAAPLNEVRSNRYVLNHVLLRAGIVTIDHIGEGGWLRCEMP